MLEEALSKPGTEAPLSFPSDRPVSVKAFQVGDRLNLRGLYEPPLAGPVVRFIGQHGVAMLFRYGAVVLFNLTEHEQQQFLAELRPRVQEPGTQPETEETHILISASDTTITTSGIALHDFGLSRLKLVAIVLARSVALASYEASVAGAFDLVEPLALNLEKESGRHMKDVLKHIGSALLIQHKMVGRVEIQDKPELLWDLPELEHLYLRLEAEYELRERNTVLERKLTVIAHTAETTVNLLHNRRMLRVEWYIVILIVVEVILFAYDIWFRQP